MEFNSDGTVYFWTNGTTEYGDIWFDGTYKLPNYNYELDRFEVTYTIKFKRYSLDKTRKYIISTIMYRIMRGLMMKNNTNV